MMRIAVTALLVLFASPRCLGQSQSQLGVQMPSMLGFNVNHVTRVTTGVPSPFTIQLSDIKLRGNARELRILVRAMAPAFRPPSGPAIPCSLVFWTTGSVQNGIGTSGTLDNAAFRTVFTIAKNARSASVGVNWNLAAPGAGIRAGAHSLTINWRIESF